MKDKLKPGVTRRKFLPLLSGLFLPFTGSGKAITDIVEPEPEYQTMLTKDGRIVKVKVKTVSDSKIVDQQLSNKSLLTWLKKNDEDI
jgi:hypothetical protein